MLPKSTLTFINQQLQRNGSVIGGKSVYRFEYRFHEKVILLERDSPTI